MRRTSFGLLLLLAASLLPAVALAQAQTVQSINGIGLVDYARKPDFKVGDWARYHLTGHSEMGMKDDYFVTVMIAGEEFWWGEDCFWVETWTDAAGRPPRTEATMMSYAVFDDSLAVAHMQLYMRKTITGLNDDGTPHIELYKRAATSLKSRATVGDQIRWKVDTLGTDSVTVGKGAFLCREVRIQQGIGATTTVGDSSVYTEVRENRTTFLNDRIPITHIAREDIDYSAARKTWMIGKSGEATHLNTMDRSLGSAELVDFGQGVEARLVPPEVRRSLREKRAAAARPAATPKQPGAGVKKPG